MTQHTILSVHGLTKSYRKDQVELPVLRGIDFEVDRGKVSALVGRSGSGKSTLMHLMAALDVPDAGEIRFGDRRIDNASRGDRDRYRNHDIGVIFQFYHLLPELTALENVLAPAMIGRSTMQYLRERATLKRRASELLERVGLSHRASHRPSEMSGGEIQRAAIARSLINAPKVLLADEPTGNLDVETGNEILSLLRDLNRQDELTILIITHDDAIAATADVCHRMIDGILEEQPSTTRKIKPSRAA